MNRADTSINALRELGRAKDFERSDLTSLSQMYKLRVKNGIERTEKKSIPGA